MNPPYLARALLFVGIDDPLDLVDFLSGESFSPREGCDKAWQGAGKSPLDYFCALRGLHDVTTVPSDFRTPRSERRRITVYVVDFFHSNRSLHRRTSSLLVTGSFSHNISQKRYSLSNIFGVSIIISAFPVYCMVRWIGEAPSNTHWSNTLNSLLV